MNPTMLAQLEALRSLPKFVDEPGTIYNGMRPEELRLDCEDVLNELLGKVMADPTDIPAKQSVLRIFSETLPRFPAGDTEDRERMCRYLEQVMDITCIESSDGVLMRWLYGDVLGEAIVAMTRRQEG